MYSKAFATGNKFVRFCDCGGTITLGPKQLARYNQGRVSLTCTTCGKFLQRTDTKLRKLKRVEAVIAEGALTRKIIWARDEGCCRYCGTESATMTLDHVVPLCQYGKSTLENLVLACARCNFMKAGRTPEQAGMPLLPVRMN